MAKERSRTIVIDVSGHGFGHLGQIAPVIVRLTEQHPTVRAVVRSALEPAVVHDIVGSGIDLEKPPPEATVVMRAPTVVDAAASGEAYRALHGDWDEHLDRETARLAALAPAALIADVPYMSLAAAKRLGIPAVALCSLNWLDIYRAYCGRRRDAPAIIRTIDAAYRSADLFLQPQPHMPMPDLSNRRSIGPVARIGRANGARIRASLGLADDVRIVLVTLGGIRLDMMGPRLPDVAGVRWIVQRNHPGGLANVTNIQHLKMSFIDVLASSDAVVTKVGYSTYAEAVCNGIGIVSAPRVDGPESRPLIHWAQENANFALAEGGMDDARGFGAALSRVLNAPRRTPVQPKRHRRSRGYHRLDRRNNLDGKPAPDRQRTPID